jgi:pimeloyl-ACP methyl ester carboxylesterase
LINGKPNYLSRISDALRAKNIAVLRYDKRGVGQSTSSRTEAEFTFDDMVADAAALIRLLKSDTRFSKVIVAGHSEGSLVGIMASQLENVDGFISLAGLGLPADAVMKSQFKDALSSDDYKMAVAVLDTIKSGKPLGQKLTNGFEIHFRPSIQPYMRSWMQYDPGSELSKLRAPVLIVQGTNDIQVSVENATLLKRAQPKAKLVLIEGMSHILKEAPADRQLNFATYSNSDLGLHPKIIPELTAFINNI